MKHLKSYNLFARCLMLACLALASAAHAAPIHIAGRVQNSTSKAPTPGLTVELLRPGATPSDAVSLKSTKSGPDGRFDFGKMELASDDLLIVQAFWQGYSYSTPAYDGAGRLKQVDMTVKPDNVDLKVFDVTRQAPPLQFQVHHVAIASRAGGLKCIERIVVLNPSLRTYVGDQANDATIKLNLPVGAHDVSLDPKMGTGQLVKTGDGYAVAKPITPIAYNNRNAIIVQYLMDWPSSLPWGRHIDLSRPLLYPTIFFFVAREESDRKLQVSGSQLLPDENQQLPIDGENQTRIINRANDQVTLGRGTTMQIGVSSDVNPLFWAFLAFLVTLCAVVPWVLWRPRQKGELRATPVAVGTPAGMASGHKIAEPDGGASVYAGTSAPVEGVSREAMDMIGASAGGAAMPSTAVPSPQARRLIEQIAGLDDTFEAGDLNASEYRSRRAAWKAQLVEELSRDATGSEER